MFGMGMGELVVILIIALLFLGPAKLPEVASSLGKAIRQFRKATQDLSDHFQIDDDVKAPLRELQAALRNDPEPYVVMPAQNRVARTLDQRAPDGKDTQPDAATHQTQAEPEVAKASTVAAVEPPAVPKA